MLLKEPPFNVEGWLTYVLKNVIVVVDRLIVAAPFERGAL